MTTDPTEAFQTIPAIAAELMNLNAIMSLPKPTEAFMSDIHGEFNAFQHVLRNGSGNVKIKIQELFRGELTERSVQELAFLVYYPKERLEATPWGEESQKEQWYRTTVQRLVRLLAYTAAKYTRSKVRKTMVPAFVYITEELLYNDPKESEKEEYYWSLITNLIAFGQADAWIIATCHTIQRLTVDRIHIVGDIYDRGPAPQRIVESLMSRRNVDVQWGNHDILWLGAAAGSPLCIANLIRISARYNNLAILEDVYGINLRHLARLAQHYYEENPAFKPNTDKGTSFKSAEEELEVNQIHQAIAIIQFKLEGPVIKRRPEFLMTHRLMLEHLSASKEKITLNGVEYPITNGAFVTVDSKDPYALNKEEQFVLDQLILAFTNSVTLRRHMDFLVEKGSMFRRYNGNLLLHGCVPVDEKGNFIGLTINNKIYRGQSLFAMLEENLRAAYANPKKTDDLATDLLWYLWTGPNSPLFGKHDMTTFERYFIADDKTHVEQKNAYYQLRHDVKFVETLLTEFGLDPKKGHVINGHTPVKRGNSPIMAERKMIVIDGGFSRPYQKTTGIGGYTLLDNARGMQIVTHQPFINKNVAIAQLTDIISSKRVIETQAKKRTVAETDIGEQIRAQIKRLQARLNRLQEDELN